MSQSNVVFVAEIIYYGNSEGHEVVVNLVSDYDKTQRENRSILMDPSITYVGVFSGSHSKRGTMSSIIFGRDKRR